MTRRVYARRNGKIVELGAKQIEESESAFVHEDSFKAPLKHPKTGEMVDSLSRWNAINREHKLEVVGNDLHSKNMSKPADKVTEERFQEAYEKAWATETDPDKSRQKRYREVRELENYFGKQSEVIKHIVRIRELDR